MNAALYAAPAAPNAGGFPLALLIAAAATVLVALAMIVIALRRAHKLTALTSWIGAAAGVAVITGALLVGGALTQSPTAVAGSAPSAPRGASGQYADVQLDGLQLPTLAYEDGSSK
jgi:hypothetical protein